MKHSVVLFIASLVAISASAYDFKIGDFGYDITGTSAVSVSSCSSSDEWIIIPSSVESDGKVYTVTAIGNAALKNISSVTSVTIPDCVKSIGNEAFAGCSNLEGLMIEAVTPPQLGTDAFPAEDGAYLPTLVIPYGSLEAYQNAEGWKQFDEIIDMFFYAGDIMYFLNDDYDACGVFNSKTREYKGDIVIPEKANGFDVVSVSEEAFMNCTGLTSVTLPASIKNIYAYAFTGCTNLASLILKSPTPPYAESEAFDIVDGVINIELTVPFDALTTYKKADVWKQFKSFVETDPVNAGGIYYEVISEEEKTCRVIAHPYASTAPSVRYSGDVTIPETLDGYKVVEIGEMAFARCEDLKSVVIPATVTKILNRAFMNSLNMRAVIVNAIEAPELISQTFGDPDSQFFPVPLIILENATGYGANSGWDKFENVVKLPASALEDVNGDGDVNGLDVLKVYKYMQAH